MRPVELAKPLIPLGFFLGWHLLAVGLEIPPYLLPSPLAVLRAFLSDPRLFLGHALVTFAEMLLGLFLASFASLLASLLLISSSLFEGALSGFLVLLQSTPLFALAPLLVVWLGYGLSSKVAMVALVSFFPMAVSLMGGLKAHERRHAELFELMGMGLWGRFVHLYLPAALPSLFGGLRASCAVAAAGAVLGEWMGSSRGLGYLMVQMNARLRVAELFACIGLLSVVSLGLWSSISLLERRVVFWREERDEA